MEGEAVFYGPKIDVKLIDAIGRPWQLSTVQFDFTLPKRFNLEYIGPDGQAHQPVMLHRALLGSVERFLGVLIEHYAGAFPIWLAPVQVVVIPIAERHHAYARQVADQLRPKRICGWNLMTETKRWATRFVKPRHRRFPTCWWSATRNRNQAQVSVRNRFSGDEGVESLESFVEKIEGFVDSRAVRP